MTDKLRNQVKSRFYYLFWSICTLSVLSGQLYVGAGYHQMTKAVNEMTQHLKDTTITLPWLQS